MSSSEAINYEPLKDSKHSRSTISLLIGGPLQIAVELITLAIVIYAATREANFYSLLPLPFLEVIVFGYIRGVRKEHAAWKAFADINGWTTTNDAKNASPSLVNIGAGGNWGPEIHATIDGVPWDILMFYQTIRTGGSDKTSGFFTVIRVKLAKQLPYMLLDCKGNGFDMNSQPAGVKKLSLEGDFDKYFQLYLQEGAQIDVLSIITPDTMQALIDDKQLLDIEIIDDSAYFTLAKAAGADELKAMITSVKSILADFNHRIKTLDYDPEHAVEKDGVLVSAISANSAHYTSKPLLRIKDNWPLIYVVVMLVGLAVYATYAVTHWHH